MQESHLKLSQRYDKQKQMKGYVEILVQNGAIIKVNIKSNKRN